MYRELDKESFASFTSKLNPPQKNMPLKDETEFVLCKEDTWLLLCTLLYHDPVRGFGTSSKIGYCKSRSQR